MNPPATEKPKLPAHLQPWPEHWLPKAEYLATIAEPLHYYKIVAALAADADRNQVSAALARLVKSGEATRTEKNFYHATGHTVASPAEAAQSWTAAQIVAACESIGRDPAPILAALRDEAHAVDEPAPESAPVVPRPLPFAGTPAEAIATARSILRDNEAQALSVGEWDELARAEGIDFAPLWLGHRETLLSGVATVTRADDCTAYWLRRDPETHPEENDADTLPEGV